VALVCCEPDVEAFVLLALAPTVTIWPLPLEPPAEPPLPPEGTAARLRSTTPITNIEKTTMPIIMGGNPVLTSLLTFFKIPCFDDL
jgi:hypothetical protein